MDLRGILQGRSPLLQAGKFRHRIQIVQPAAGQDTTGGWVTSQPTVVLTCWATIETMTAAERFAGHQFVSQVTHAVYIRHPRTSVQRITAGLVVWYDKRQFQIRGVVDPDQRKKVLVLLCIEVGDSVEQASASPAEVSI